MMDHELTEDEIKSLRECPADNIMFPEAGNRTACVKYPLFAKDLVRVVRYSDESDDAMFVTWQRTPAGDRLLAELDAQTSPQKAA